MCLAFVGGIAVGYLSAIAIALYLTHVDESKGKG